MATSLKNYLVPNIGLTPTTVYNPTTAGIQATVVGMTLANTTSSPITASITLTSGVTTAYLIKNVIIPAGNAYNVTGDIKIFIEQNDILQVVSSVASSVDVVLSSVEVA